MSDQHDKERHCSAGVTFYAGSLQLKWALRCGTGGQSEVQFRRERANFVPELPNRIATLIIGRRLLAGHSPHERPGACHHVELRHFIADLTLIVCAALELE